MSDMNEGLGRIGNVAFTCSASFDFISRGVKCHSTIHDNSMLPSRSEDNQSRYQIWGSNLGVKHSKLDPESADYRLREDPERANRIVELLEELTEVNGEILEMVSGQRVNRQITGSISDEEVLAPEAESRDELSDLYLSVGDIITSLFKVSTSTRKAVKTDPYVQAARSGRPLPTEYDVQHVAEKFPKARKHQWLLERLGNAITQRRQFLRHSRDHRNRIAYISLPNFGLPEPADNAPIKTQDTEPPSFGQTSHNEPPHSPVRSLYARSASTRSTRSGTATSSIRSASTRPTSGPTSASSIQADKFYIAHDDVQVCLSDEASSGGSPVAYVEPGTWSAIHPHVIPLVEASENSELFECRYCFRIIQIQAKRQKVWERHVFSDLRAYVCLFKDCNARLFETKGQWIRHEMESHRRQWDCQHCTDEAFDSNEGLREHLDHSHAETSFPEELFAQVVDASSRPLTEVAADCPLCEEVGAAVGKTTNRTGTSTPSEPHAKIPLGEFHEHLARHQEELALFAIPPPATDSAESGRSRRHTSFENNEREKITRQWQNSLYELDLSTELRHEGTVNPGSDRDLAISPAALYVENYMYSDEEPVAGTGIERLPATRPRGPPNSTDPPGGDKAAIQQHDSQHYAPLPRRESSPKGTPGSWDDLEYPSGRFQRDESPLQRKSDGRQIPGPAHSPPVCDKFEDFYRNAVRQIMSGQTTSESPQALFCANMYPTQYPGYDANNNPNDAPTLPPSSSARYSTTAPPGLELGVAKAARQQPSMPTLSARRSSIMPGSFVGEGAFFKSSRTDSFSSSSGSNSDKRRLARERHGHRSDQSREDARERARRDLEAMPPPPDHYGNDGWASLVAEHTFGSDADSQLSASDSEGEHRHEDEHRKHRERSVRRKSGQNPHNWHKRDRHDSEAMPPPSQRRPTYRRSSERTQSSAGHTSSDRSNDAQHREKDTSSASYSETERTRPGRVDRRTRRESGDEDQTSDVVSSGLVGHSRTARTGVEKASFSDSETSRRPHQRSIPPGPSGYQNADSWQSPHAKQSNVNDTGEEKTHYNTPREAEPTAPRLKAHDDMNVASEGGNVNAPKPATNEGRRQMQQPRRKAPSSTRMSPLETTGVPDLEGFKSRFLEPHPQYTRSKLAVGRKTHGARSSISASRAALSTRRPVFTGDDGYSDSDFDERDRKIDGVQTEGKETSVRGLASPTKEPLYRELPEAREGDSPPGVAAAAHGEVIELEDHTETSTDEPPHRPINFEEPPQPFPANTQSTPDPDQDETQEDYTQHSDRPGYKEGKTPKSIMKTPTAQFPEDPNATREGAAPPTKATNKDVPAGARWTKIDRRLVNPEALTKANERFEERRDFVIVLRVLTKDEIQKLADATRDIRAAAREREEPLTSRKEE